MSDLPKYSYANDHADLESAPLMSAEGQAENGWSKNVASPQPPTTSGGVGQGSSGQRHNVLYVFEPRYPMKGEREQVVGLLGRSKAECCTIAQRAFPALLAYPDERLVFEVCSVPPYDSPHMTHNGPRPPPPPGVPHGHPHASYPPGNQGWSRIMDEAWDQFATCPPARLRVRVEDTAVEIAARKKYMRRSAFKFIGIPVLVIMLFFAGFIYMLNEYDEYEE